jgi:ribonucleotide monophosphatase NagD (HAD superfamily)
MTRILDSLRDVSANYDALLCDIWGVIHNGHAAFPGAAEALMNFRASGGRVVLISNVPKPRDPIPGQLDRLGFPREAYDVVVTSGDTIRAELKKRAPGPMLTIGDAGDEVLWDGLGIMRAGLELAQFNAVAGVDNPFARDAVSAYDELLHEARARAGDVVGEPRSCGACGRSVDDLRGRAGASLCGDRRHGGDGRQTARADL